MDRTKLAWDIRDGGMEVDIIYDGHIVMTLAVESIIEGSSRTRVLNHIIECDDTPWLTRWQEEKQAAYEAGQEKALDILRGTF